VSEGKRIGVFAHIDHDRTALAALLIRAVGVGVPILTADPTPIAPVKTKRKSAALNPTPERTNDEQG
jgi:hypothetical protein